VSDDWDFYFARVNDAVTSIFVDLGVRNDAPLEKRPWLLVVSVQLRTPRDDGLATQEEAQKLHEIGTALDSMISVTCGAQLVGRVTGSGRREFYFYAAEPGELEAAAERVMKSYDGYEYEVVSLFQPDWDQYFHLYPSDSNLERMQNRQLLEQLAEQGDDHELPRKVEHWLHFADAESRDACRDTLAAIDFVIEDESESEEEGEMLPFGLVVSRTDSVDTHTINGITLELARLAREHGGRYEGWEAPVTLAAGGEA
jgi:regulator of RNase E activity RraB